VVAVIRRSWNSGLAVFFCFCAAGSPISLIDPAFLRYIEPFFEYENV